MNSFDRLRWGMTLRTLHRRVLCIGGHKWDPEPSFVITCGPVNVPPREREWNTHGAFRQCDRCYVTQNVSVTSAQADAAIERELAAEEAVWQS